MLTDDIRYLFVLMIFVSTDIRHLFCWGQQCLLISDTRSDILCVGCSDAYNTYLAGGIYDIPLVEKIIAPKPDMNKMSSSTSGNLFMHP